MPTVDVSDQPLERADAQHLVTWAYQGDDETPAPEATALQVAAASGVDLARELATLAFDGSTGSLAWVPLRSGDATRALLVAGLGKSDALDASAVRRASAAVAGAVERIDRLAIALPSALDLDVRVRALVEGVLLGSYRFVDYRTDPKPHRLEQVTLHTAAADATQVAAHVAVAEVTCAAAALARDLVNTPPQDKRPPELAERALQTVSGLPVRTTVLDEDALAEGGYGGMIGVGQGSSAPPRLVELSYQPDGATRHVALVGKGITFDTGGLSLKPSSSMETMKVDMAGAAAVLATVRAAAELELNIRVTGLLALAENMPSGTATRVSDVLTMHDGTTVEVINTDAEGRLVLADAIAHANSIGPDVIVDVATLTGAAVVALGDRISAMMSDDDELAGQLLAAAADAGEPLWRLPLATDEYGERVEGTVADLRNVGGRAAGTIFGGLFLHHFVGDDIAWAHFDIAGPAWVDEPYAEYGKGGTGAPVRTLVAWLRGL